MIPPLRTGIGYDVHRFTENRLLILGGVTIPYEKGLAGHSDADVLVHAIMDALLGAAGLGDIGSHFPDNDSSYQNISSLKLLDRVYLLLLAENYEIVNIDSIIICEEPKIIPHVHEMKQKISHHIGNIAEERIGIKATTTEKCGFAGRKEAIAVQSTCLLYQNYPPKKNI